jgi:hypothetical protein
MISKIRSKNKIKVRTMSRNKKCTFDCKIEKKSKRY